MLRGLTDWQDTPSHVYLSVDRLINCVILNGVQKTKFLYKVVFGKGEMTEFYSLMLIA